MDISIEKARLLGEKDSVNPVDTSNFGVNLTNVPKVKFAVNEDSNKPNDIARDFDEAEETALLGGRCLGVAHKISNKDTQEIGEARKVVIRNGVHSIKKGAFSACRGIEEVEIPDSISKIPDRAFKDCTNLRKVRLHENISKIGEEAFGNCENLVELSPKLRTDICDFTAFKGCSKLDFSKSLDIDLEDYHEEISDDRFNFKGSNIIIDDKRDTRLFTWHSVAEGSQEVERRPVMSEIRQGDIADCWLLAALASIANFQPGVIKNIIKENSDGTTVDVTFQRELLSGVFRKETYTVEKSTFRTIGRGRIMSKYPASLWAQMIEKAFSAYLAKGQNSIDFNNLAMGGGGSKNAFKAILGKDARKDIGLLFDRDVAGLFNTIKSALDENVPMHCSSPGLRKIRGVNGNKVYHFHAYSIIGAEERDGEYYITLRNPWGNNDGNDYDENDAIITVDLKEISKGLFIVRNAKRPE